jgi:hypothetical protein
LSPTFSALQTYTISLRWKLGELTRLTVNDTITDSTAPMTVAPNIASVMGIGTGNQDDQSWTSVLVVYDRPLTDAERTTAFAALNAGTFGWDTLEVDQASVRMQRPLLLVKPEGSRDRSGPITPTITGDVPVKTVGGHKAWEVWEGTTNYHLNPLMTTSDSGWTSYSSGGARQTGVNIIHPENGMVINAAFVNTVFSNIYVGGWRTTQPTILAQGTTVTVSAVVVATGATIGKSGAISAVAQGGPEPSQVVSKSFVWPAVPTVISQTFTVAHAGRTSVDGVVSVNSPGVGDWAAATAGQIEAKAYATPFTPRYENGVIAPGNSWTGTPDASTSTRAGARISLASAPINTVEGENIAVITTPNMQAINGGAASLWRYGLWNGTDGDYLSLYRLSASGVIFAPRLDGNNVGTVTVPLPAGLDGIPLIFSTRWDAAASYLEVRRLDTLAVVGSALTPRVLGSKGYVTTANTNLSLLANEGSSNQHGNAQLRLSVFYNKPLTAAERTRAMAAIAAGTFTWETLMPRVAGILQTHQAPRVGGILQVSQGVRTGILQTGGA